MITDEKPLKLAEQQQRTETDIQKDYAIGCQEIGDMHMAIHQLETEIEAKRKKLIFHKQEFQTLKQQEIHDETIPFNKTIAP